MDSRRVVLGAQTVRPARGAQLFRSSDIFKRGAGHLMDSGRLVKSKPFRSGRKWRRDLAPPLASQLASQPARLCCRLWARALDSNSTSCDNFAATADHTNNVSFQYIANNNNNNNTNNAKRKTLNAHLHWRARTGDILQPG